ncbi:hypothetical protein [Tenacibaculum sp. L6]|uniref:hypothetical protein n=1 Tax=Tenacibaculum sp. L6 TaxID=2992764 RepID=UPI00237BECA5|nr:hypothetical protein [Tenacibaculum sp. L6]MDE0536144.1 hypothetical protein [Tenacibaculum sp. L6]
MKKFFYLLFVIICLSCSENTNINNCFGNFSFIESFDLNNPEFISILTPGNHVITSRSGRNLLIINRGGTPKYHAFDLQCPEKDCSSPMTFDGLKLNCVCGDHHYSSYSGFPVDKEGTQIDGDCNALMYFTTPLSGNRLRISR